MKSVHATRRGARKSVERCSDRFCRGLEVGLLLSIAVLCACVERTRDAPKPRARPTARTTTSAVSAPPAMAATPAPSGPPVRLFAKRFVVKVREAPAQAAFRLGYVRGGAVMQALTAEPVGFDQCRKGWYQLDTGGFVCATVDATPFLGTRLPERQPLQADMLAPLPYPYGYNRRQNTPMFRRLPSDQEAALYESGRAPPPARARANAANAPPAPSPNDAPVGRVTAPAPTPALPLVVAAGGEEEPDAPESGMPTLASLMGEQGSVLMRRMARGFYVSLDREMTKGTRDYWRTQSNGFIASQGLTLVHGSDFHGVALEEQAVALPIAFVMSKDSLAYKAGAHGQLQRAGEPGYHFMLPIASENDVHGTHYVLDAEGVHYRAKDVRRIDAREKPAEVSEDEKWIDVDLSTQSLVASIGSRPVYATLISSGRVKDVLDPQKNFETPSGSFRVLSKHRTATMDGDQAIDGPYSIEDVPYVMYFQLAYALHSAFWHDSFGRPHSHGCINMAPRDAKWLFEFVEPPLPNGWHGVYPKPKEPGTRLYIHGLTPQG
jgi:hypothetical protein